MHRREESNGGKEGKAAELNGTRKDTHYRQLAGTRTVLEHGRLQDPSLDSERARGMVDRHAELADVFRLSVGEDTKTILDAPQTFGGFLGGEVEAEEHLRALIARRIHQILTHLSFSRVELAFSLT